MIFQWDDKKTAKNRSKHGVSFELASLVFADPLSVSRKDKADAGELRWQIIGHVQAVQLLLVVYTVRDQTDEETIRLISARKATRQERREYENGRWFS